MSYYQTDRKNKDYYSDVQTEIRDNFFSERCFNFFKDNLSRTTDEPMKLSHPWWINITI